MRLGTLLLALAASTALAAAAHAQSTIKLGLSGPFTGGSASMGVSMRDGVRLAVAEINKAGGVLGKQLQVVERDDEAKNEVGVQIAQELINKEQVVATLGFINTGVALASQRFYQEAEIPVLNNVATGTVISSQFKSPNYIFRTSAADAIQAPMIVDEAITRRGFKKPAILADSTSYGQLGREDLEKALAAKGVKSVSTEKFNIGDTVKVHARVVEGGGECADRDERHERDSRRYLFRRKFHHAHQSQCRRYADGHGKFHLQQCRGCERLAGLARWRV